MRERYLWQGILDTALAPGFDDIVVACAALRAEPLERRQLPATAAWFVHIDLESAKTSTLAQALREIGIKQPGASEALSKVQDALGIDPARDIRSLTLYGVTLCRIMAF